MFLRGHLAPNYSAPAPERVNLAGYIKTEMVNNVETMWPVARPCNGWNGSGAPYYLGTPQECRAPKNRLIRSGGFKFTPGQPALEMDPSDHTTWQRQYRFDQGI